jgi:hypothetical protein
MDMVIPEAFEAVDEGRMDAAQLEAFVFSNAVHLHGSLNPSFFDGTAVEKEARAVLAPPAPD